MANKSKDSYDKDQVNLIDWILIALITCIFLWGIDQNVAGSNKKNQIVKIERAIAYK